MKPGIDAKDAIRPAGPWAAGVTPEARCREIDGASRSSVQPPDVIRLGRGYREQPSRIFDAWLNPAVASRWLFATATRAMTHVEIDPRVAGTFCFADRREPKSIEYRGEYSEIVPDRRLVFTLWLPRDPQVITRVIVEIVPVNAGSYLTLTHENVPSDHRSYLAQRWTGILYGLGETLEMQAEPFHYEQE